MSPGRAVLLGIGALVIIAAASPHHAASTTAPKAPPTSWVILNGHFYERASDTHYVYCVPKGRDEPQRQVFITAYQDYNSGAALDSGQPCPDGSVH